MRALLNTVTHFAGGETCRAHAVRLGTAASRFISSVEHLHFCGQTLLMWSPELLHLKQSDLNG